MHIKNFSLKLPKKNFKNKSKTVMNYLPSLILLNSILDFKYFKVYNQYYNIINLTVSSLFS